MGNHTVTQNLKMNGHWISNDGGNEGIKVLDNGNVIIGNNGDELEEILRVKIIKDVGNISSNNSLWVNFNVPGAKVGGVVSISPHIELAGRLVIAYANVNTVGAVRVNFRNVGGSSDNPPMTQYNIAVIQ